MQKTTFLVGSLLLALSLSSTSAYAQPALGTTTDSAIYISSLPYTTTDDTANYADLIDPPTSVPLSCGAGTSGHYYMSGNDVVYKFVPTINANVNITMPNAIAWSAVFVYDEPSDIGTSTVYACSANSSSGNRVISNLPVVAGEDYYIIVSVWPSPQTFEYTLTVELAAGNETCAELMMPDGASMQNFDFEATVADLEINGAGINWFADEAMTEPLAADTILESGTTYYAQSSLGDCTSSAFPVEVNVTLATAENRDLHFEYYPNPMGDALHLKSAVDMQTIEIYNMIGQMVQKHTLDGRLHTVPTAQLQNGQYLARITFANGVEQMVKLMK